jgi:hypothetical protein
MMDDLTANRLVTELMLVSVVVAGEGADELARALERAGAAAEPLAAANPAGGYDLAVLRAPSDPAAAPGHDALVTALAEASERLLLVPDAPAGDAPHDPSGLAAWFEKFIEHGYQPVVDFDAGFVAPGAFLVDRAATAGEAELAAFADRLQAPATPAPRPDPAPQQTPSAPPELQSLHAKLAEQEARLADLAGRAAAAEAALHDAASQNAGWDGLRTWVNAAMRDPARDTAEALRRDLPRLNALLGNGSTAPILQADILAAPPSPAAASPGAALPARVSPAAPAFRAGLPGWLGRLFSRAKSPAADPLNALLEDTALVRASRFFDPAWYIASAAELAAGETVDPVFHYVLVGGPRGTDPGPWFDSAAYLAAHPEAKQGSQAPLLHAIRSGAREVAEHAAPDA